MILLLRLLILLLVHHLLLLELLVLLLLRRLVLLLLRLVVLVVLVLGSVLMLGTLVLPVQTDSVEPVPVLNVLGELSSVIVPESRLDLLGCVQHGLLLVLPLLPLLKEVGLTTATLLLVVGIVVTLGLDVGVKLGGVRQLGGRGTRRGGLAVRIHRRSYV